MKINYKKALLFIIFFSFILKMGAGFYLKDSFLKRGNSHTPMNAIAANLVENGKYQIIKGVPSIDYEPLYPGLMALSYKIFGFNWFGLTLFQGVLFSISSWLLFLIGKLLLDERAGFIAALYHSFYPYLFSYSLSIYDTTLFVFLYLLVIYLLVYPSENQIKYAWIGGCLGLAMLTRGSIIALIPAILIYIFLDTKKTFQFSLLARRISLLAIFCFLVLSPWLFRNFQLTGKMVISTHGSYGLWQGNNEHSYYFLKNNISLDRVSDRKLSLRIIAELPGGVRSPFDAIKVANIYRDEAISFIKADLSRFFRLAILKFMKFWSWVRNPASSTLEFGSNRSRKTVFLVSYFPLLLFLPAGLLILWKKRKLGFYLFFGIIFFYTLAHMIAMGFTRARVPIDPLLMIVTGVCVSSIFSRLKIKSPIAK